MAYAYRGRRVAYDNVAAGSVAGYENHIAVRTSPFSSDDASNGVSTVSNQGTRENITPGTSGSVDNIAAGAVVGVEGYMLFGADGTVTPQKLTSEGETITDTPSVD